MHILPQTDEPPAPVPLDDYVDLLWRAVKAGAITWPELQALQLEYVSTKEPVPLPSVIAIRSQMRGRS